MHQFLILSLLLNSVMFLMMNHPLTMGFTLLIQTIIVSILTGSMTKTFWFSYILFLVFLGGMLILFMYMVSLASNEMFHFKPINTIIIIMIVFILLFLFLGLDSMMMNSMSNLEMNNLVNQPQFNFENSITLYKMYNFPVNFTNMLLMNYLLITLIAVVKMSSINKGPLRNMSYE